MKLLFINYEFPPIGGGGGRVSENLARELAKNGHAITVLSSAFRDLPKVEKRDGYEIVRIPTLRRREDRCSIFEMAVFLLSSIFHALKWARKNRPDCTLTFFTIPCGPAAYFLKKCLGIPYVISLQGGDVPGFKGGAILRLYHTLCRIPIRFLWKHAESVIANSRGLGELAAKTSTRNIEVIPNGVDLAQFSLPAPRPLAEDSETTRFLSAGRLSAQKNLSLLIRAFAQLIESGAKASLSVVGDGPLRGELETLVKDLGISAQVTFFGWRSAEELKSFYTRSDVFVMSSIDEGMPIAVLEATAMGLPIVGTRVSGMDELVKPGVNGYLVDSGDQNALTEAIKKMIHHPRETRTQMGKASLHIASTYSWDMIALRYLKQCHAAVSRTRIE